MTNIEQEGGGNGNPQYTNGNSIVVEKGMTNIEKWRVEFLKERFNTASFMRSYGIDDNDTLSAEEIEELLESFFDSKVGFILTLLQSEQTRIVEEVEKLIVGCDELDIPPIYKTSFSGEVTYKDGHNHGIKKTLSIIKQGK